MLSEKHVYFYVIINNALTRCMLLYVDTYQVLWSKMWVLIKLTQNVHTGRPPNALPFSTHSYYSTTVPQNISAVWYVLSASCNELELMAPSIADVSYFSIPSLVDQFQLLFLDR